MICLCGRAWIVLVHCILLILCLKAWSFAAIMPTGSRHLASFLYRPTFLYRSRHLSFHPNAHLCSSIIRASQPVMATKKATTKSSTPTTRTKNKQSKNMNINPTGYQLVIVESPSKASTISSILNNYAQSHSLPYTFLVDSCKGHVRDLPESMKQLPNNALVYTPSSIHGQLLETLPEHEKKEFVSPVLGVRIANKSYDPIYIIMPQKTEVVQHLQKLASTQNGCMGIILATDEDREGEAIAYHLSQILTPPSPRSSSILPMKRVTFNEITKTSIESAFFGDSQNSNTDLPLLQHMDDILDMDLVQAQETRRILDRIAGYPMSLLLCKKIAPGLSAGRVQSVGLSLIVHRERERMTFKQSEYYDIQAMLDTSKNPSSSSFSSTNASIFEATLIKINQKRIATGSDFDPKTGLLFSNPRTENNIDTDDTKSDDERNIANITSSVHHLTKESTDELLTRIRDSSRWAVTSIERKEKSYSPPLPFTTSTLQQESNKRLGLSVSDTMKCAQILYEAGLISYMRTDSNFLSEDAIQASKSVVVGNFGSTYLNEDSGNEHTRRKKKGKQGNILAQEAHEAIRPSIQSDGSFISPRDVATHYTRESNGYTMTDSLFKLYQLIYERTVAYFMKNQIMEQTTVLVDCVTKDDLLTLTFRASGSVVIFDGYTKLTSHTVETSSDNTETDRQPSRNFSKLLPSGLEKGKELQCREAVGKSHITKPPPRYSEASFVKDLETLGVGRPSTYASIVQTLKSRFYVGSSSGNTSRRSGSSIRGSAISASRAAGGSGNISIHDNLIYKAEFFLTHCLYERLILGIEVAASGNGPLVPSLSAFVVCSLLEKYCPTYVDPTFTARMEERLDRIADGENTQEARRAYLEEYYGGDDGLAAQVEKINRELTGDEVRRVHLPTLKSDKVGIFIGPWGPYIKRLDDHSKSPHVAQLPLSMASDISSITDESLEAILVSRENNGNILGHHPEDGRPIRLRVGRFGAYLQWGEPGEKNTTNHSLPKHFNRLLESLEVMRDDYTGPNLSLDDAISYINLPRVVSELNGMPITAGLGPYGPYLRYNNTYTGLKSDDGDIITIQAEKAEEIIKERIQNKVDSKRRGVVLGEKEGSQITLKMGRFGPYLNWKSINVRLPSTYNATTSQPIQLKEAWELISTKTKKDRSSKNGKKGKQDLTSSDLISTETKENLPPRPRRPMSAYLYFCAGKRPEVSSSLKTLSEISKELSRLWSQLESVPNGRKPYEVQASEAKAQYEQEIDKWRKLFSPPATVDVSSSTNATLQVFKHGVQVKEEEHNKEEVKVKRAPSAYMIFCRDNRDKVSITADGERLRLGDVTKHLAKLWKECDEEKKEVYRVKAKQFSSTSL